MVVTLQTFQTHLPKAKALRNIKNSWGKRLKHATFHIDVLRQAFSDFFLFQVFEIITDSVPNSPLWLEPFELVKTQLGLIFARDWLNVLQWPTVQSLRLTDRAEKQEKVEDGLICRFLWRQKAKKQVCVWRMVEQTSLCPQLQVISPWSSVKRSKLLQLLWKTRGWEEDIG